MLERNWWCGEGLYVKMGENIKKRWYIYRSCVQCFWGAGLSIEGKAGWKMIECLGDGIGAVLIGYACVAC